MNGIAVMKVKDLLRVKGGPNLQKHNKTFHHLVSLPAVNHTDGDHGCAGRIFVNPYSNPGAHG